MGQATACGEVSCSITSGVIRFEGLEANAADVNTVSGRVEMDFTEYATAKKLWMRPFVKGFLKKQQAQFVSDLEKALADMPK